MRLSGGFGAIFGNHQHWKYKLNFCGGIKREKEKLSKY
jgi:hypothetical protein